MRSQVLHIFRKDVRHHWPEMLLCLLAVVAYAWREYRSWGAPNGRFDVYEVLLSFVPVLVVVSWAFLIARLVQGESLVGDRQFWVTRPYDWRKLLAAKLLSILVFVNIPLFCMQVFLLLVAGFAPSTHLLGLFWLQLLWTAFVFLPLFTLAAVTASIVQFVLGVLGGFVYLLVLSAILSHLPDSGVSGAATIPTGLAGLGLLGTGLAIVLWQYSRRIAAPSRVLLSGALLFVPVLFAVTPYRMLIAHIYPPPRAGQQLPVILAFDPEKPASRGRGYPEKNKVHVSIPLLASGIAEGTKVIAGGRMVTILALGGKPWSSGWQDPAEVFLPDIRHNATILSIDKDFFERVKSSAVNVHITYALLPRRAQQTTRIVAQGAGFAVPGEGRCSYSPFDPYVVSCVFPLKVPSQLVRARSEEVTCAPRKDETPLPAGTTLYGGTRWDRDEGLAGFGMSPVKAMAFSFWSWSEANNRTDHSRVCPGTPLTFFTRWQALQPVRSELEISGIRLADYQLNDASEGGTVVGISVP